MAESALTRNLTTLAASSESARSVAEHFPWPELHRGEEPPRVRRGGAIGHFHYVPEITLAWAWSLPAGFTQVVPY